MLRLPVDTSTGVLSDPKMIAETVKEVSPDTLVSPAANFIDFR